MCARFLGLPQQVTGFRSVFIKDYPLPDDNAMVMMKYAHAFGVAEASWTQTVGYATNNPVAYGTGGSLAVAGDKVILQTPGKVETIEPAALQSPRSNGPEYFIHCLESGEPIEGFCSMQVSRDAQEILEAGKRAADTGQTMNLPLS
jgi:predicted dehydrogenase